MNESIEQSGAAGFGHNLDDLVGSGDRRCPTVLLLDTSGSMAGTPISELQAGLTQYIDEVAADNLANRRLEIAIVTFGGTVKVTQSFSAPNRIILPTLSASGDTPMGAAIVEALNLLKERRIELSQQAISQYKPWVFMITDGGPTDDGQPVWQEAISRLTESRQNKTQFFAVAVEGANMETLAHLCNQTRPDCEEARPPIKLQGLKFRELFQWITQSQKAITQSRPGENVTFPSISGWASGLS